MKPVLLDSSVIVALLDKRERLHERCVRVVDELEQPLATCEAVISESCFLLRKIPNASDRILANVEEEIFQVPFQLPRSAASVHAILRKYRNLPAGFADACLVHMADQLDTGDILTLDSDFSHYRWRRTRTFRMLIPLE
ncbi:MAG: PIN domain-containing protein [Terracidiphilus sp.]|jgi:predicted nucleic acid-binding protein